MVCSYTTDVQQLQPMLDLELEVEVVSEIVELVEEGGPDFDVLLWETPGVVPGNLHLLVFLKSGGDGDSIRFQWIVIV